MSGQSRVPGQVCSFCCSSFLSYRASSSSRRSRVVQGTYRTVAVVLHSLPGQSKEVEVEEEHRRHMRVVRAALTGHTQPEGAARSTRWEEYRILEAA